MITSDIVLRYFAFIDSHGFGQKVGGEALLQQGITFVFLIDKDGANSGRSPDTLPSRSSNPLISEAFSDSLLCGDAPSRNRA